MLLWMERLKYGLCDIKMTFGRQWMQLWRLNWYGRAVNARHHLERIVGDHVNARDKLVPVIHEQGHSVRDPFATAMPLVSVLVFCKGNFCLKPSFVLLFHLFILP